MPARVAGARRAAEGGEGAANVYGGRRLWGWGPAAERLVIGGVQPPINRCAAASWRNAPFRRVADLFFRAPQIFKIPFSIQFVVLPNSIPSEPKVGMTIGIDNLSRIRIKNESK